MPYALVGLVDTTETTPFGKTVRRFFGADAEPGTNLVRIAVDQAILWTPTITLADAKATVLADSSDDTITPGRRSVLNALAGDRTFQPTDRIKDIIFNLLRTPPVGKWAALQPTRAGRYELFLGPGGVGQNLIASELTSPDGPHSQDIQDTFLRADGTLNGSTSSDSQFTWGLIVGNAANENVVAAAALSTNGAALGNGVYRSTLAMDTGNHYSQADLVGFGGGSGSGHRQDFSVWIRANHPTYDHSYAFVIRNGETPRRFFQDSANGIEIAFDTTSTNTGTMYVEMNGSTYTAKLAGATLFTGTDTTHDGSGTQRTVLTNAYRNASSDTVNWDNFRAADLSAPAQSQAPRTMQQSRLRR